MQMVAALISSIPEEINGMLATKTSAKEAWTSIRTQRLSNYRMHEASVQRLRVYSENIIFKDGERVDDFFMWIDNLATQLRLLGDTVDDERIV